MLKSVRSSSEGCFSHGFPLEAGKRLAATGSRGSVGSSSLVPGRPKRDERPIGPTTGQNSCLAGAAGPALTPPPLTRPQTAHLRSGPLPLPSPASGGFLRCDTAKDCGRSVRRGIACLRPAGTRSPTSPLLPAAHRRHLVPPPRRHLFPSSAGRTDAAGGAGRRCRVCGGALGACLCGTVGGGGSCFRFRCPCCRREVRGPRAEMWRNLLVRPLGRAGEGKGGKEPATAVSAHRGAAEPGGGPSGGCRCPAGLQDSAAW